MDLSDSLENEYLCLKLMNGFGLRTANVEMAQFGDSKALVVERFDRLWTSDGRLIRLPQEDCCQALSVAPTQKYQSDGGPGIVAIMDLLQGSDEPNKDRYDFFKTTVLFWLLGATDGHAKNFSLSLIPGGRFQMAPLYDVLTVQPAIDARQLEHKNFKLAMHFGNSNHYRVKKNFRRHIEETAVGSSLSRNVVMKLFEELQDMSVRIVDEIIDRLPPGFRDELLADLFLGLIVRLPKKNGRAAVVLPDGSQFGEGVKTRLKEHLMEECNLHTIIRLPNPVFRPYASIGTNLLLFQKGEPTKDTWYWEHRVPEGQKAYSMTRPIRLEHLQDCIGWRSGSERKGREKTERARKVTADEVEARGYNLDIKNPHTEDYDHGDPEKLLADLAKAETEITAIRDQVEGSPVGGARSMNADRLLALFEHVVEEAPDAIARLRRFVPDLAVRGRLVEQDSTYEPATELPGRIAAEKARLVKSGEIKKPKAFPPIDEPPFAIPLNWTWTRLGIVSSYIQRGKSPQFAPADGAPVISQKCVQWSDLDLAAVKQVTLESLAKYEPIRFLRDGDLLWNSTGTGTIGRVIRLSDPPDRLICDIHVTVVRCLEADPEYIRTWLRTDHVYGVIEERAAGSTNQVELIAQIANAQPVPLPPVAEQRRIVAKVEELMALMPAEEREVAA